VENNASTKGSHDYSAAVVATIGLITVASILFILDGKKIFIVHGKDEELQKEVQFFVEQDFGKKANSLETAAGSRTLDDELRRKINDSDYAIILMTEDNEIRQLGMHDKLEPCSRLNVYYEAGMCSIKFGDRMTFIVDNGELIQGKGASDLNGIHFIKRDNWKDGLRKDLIKAGFKSISSQDRN